jgi:hypothetical protein
MQKYKAILIAIRSTLIFLTSTYYIQAQDIPVVISGNFQQMPLKTFFNEVEQKYPVRFFFEDKDIDSITFTAVFNEIPLKQCLSTLLEKESLNFFISGRQIVIYSGFPLSDLFPGSDIGKESIQEARERKLSREKFHQLQYQIINVGLPGINKSKTAVLSGYLRNYDSGEPVIGGNVFITEIQKGVSTDDKGFYKISLPVGNQTINFSCIGMESVKRNINLYSDGNLDVEMEVKVKVLDDAIIIGHGEGHLGQMHVGMERINIITIKSIPTLLGEADIIKSALTLPGVQTVGEGTSGFNVRGGNTDQNLILIDQVPIYYPSHFFGNFSAINPEIIENATLYKGSIPVKYGGRISSVFEINTIEGNHEKISGSAGISPISAHINMDGPLFSEKSTFLASFRTTYSNWLFGKIKVVELYKSKASFYDAQVKLNLYLNENNDLLINFYSSNDKFQLKSDTTYNYSNLITSFSLKHTYNNKLKSSSSLYCSLFNYDIVNENLTDQSFSLTHSLANISLVNDFEYFSNSRMKLNFGAAVNFYSINPGERRALNNSNIISIYTKNERATEFGIYAGSEYNLSGNLKIEGGIRLSGLISFDEGKKYVYADNLPFREEFIIDTIFTNNNNISCTYLNPEWRISANYSAGRFSSVKLSYNKTAQYIHLLSNTMAISPTDTWKLSDRYLLPETGHQISAGYFKSFRKTSIETSAEIFYKWINNIKEYKAGADLVLNDHIETEIVNGVGRAYGIELSVNKSGGRIYGRMDYTYSRTLIKSVSDFKEELINNGKFFPANYDKPHNLNVLTNLKVSRRFIISASITYSTGRPITYPVAKYQLGDQVFLQYSKYNQYRLPDYFRTDLSATVNNNLKKRRLARSSLTFSLYNLTSRKNAYSVYFKSEEGKFQAYQLSIFGTIIPTIIYNIKF